MVADRVIRAECSGPCELALAAAGCTVELIGTGVEETAVVQLSAPAGSAGVELVADARVVTARRAGRLAMGALRAEM